LLVTSTWIVRFESKCSLLRHALSVFPSVAELKLNVCLQSGLQFRPSKIGRPKGSRNKFLRAEHINQAPFLLEPVQNFDSAIDLEYKMPVPPTVFSPSESAEPALQQSNNNTNEPPQICSVLSHAPPCYRRCEDSRSTAQFSATISTAPDHAIVYNCGTFEPPSPGGARPISHHDAHDPSATAAAPDAAALGGPSFENLGAHRSYPAAAPAVDARPFEPSDSYHHRAPDAAAPPHGAPGFADPFHFDWPHW
jgi:hypothetical protein